MDVKDDIQPGILSASQKDIYAEMSSIPLDSVKESAQSCAVKDIYESVPTETQNGMKDIYIEMNSVPMQSLKENPQDATYDNVPTETLRENISVDPDAYTPGERASTCTPMEVVRPLSPIKDIYSKVNLKMKKKNRQALLESDRETEFHEEEDPNAAIYAVINNVQKLKSSQAETKRHTNDYSGETEDNPSMWEKEMPSSSDRRAQEQHLSLAYGGSSTTPLKRVTAPHRTSANEESETFLSERVGGLRVFKDGKLGCKTHLCIFITIGVMLIAAVVCFALVFIEFNKLKTKTGAFSNHLSLYQQMLNSSISSLHQQLEQSQSERMQQIAPDLQQVSILQNQSQHLLDSLEMQQISVLQLLAGLGEPGQYSTFPITTCAALPPSSLSGYYWVRNAIGSSVRIFCDMTRSCGNITGGWMRVAELDMTNHSHQCPSGLRQQVYNASNIRTCVRAVDQSGCSSVMFSTSNIVYSRICGRIRAYQYNSTNAFRGRLNNSIDSPYVDGVSLTHGSPREHVWTFAAALDEEGTSRSSTCSCNHTEPRTPAFVGADFFCDTGTSFYSSSRRNQFYSRHSLWDWTNCTSACCSFNNPPWFYKQLQLSASTIEMRVCRDQESFDEDIAIEVVQMFVH